MYLLPADRSMLRTREAEKLSMYRIARSLLSESPRCVSARGLEEKYDRTKDT